MWPSSDGLTQLVTSFLFSPAGALQRTGGGMERDAWTACGQAAQHGTDWVHSVITVEFLQTWSLFSSEEKSPPLTWPASLTIYTNAGSPLIPPLIPLETEQKQTETDPPIPLCNFNTDFEAGKRRTEATLKRLCYRGYRQPLAAFPCHQLASMLCVKWV